MKKIILTLCILGIPHQLSAMKNDIPIVQLPSQQEIAYRLNALKLQDFVTKTKIDYTLGDQKENVLSTNCAVACALYKYESAPFDKNEPSTKQFNIIVAYQKKPDIIAAILKDHPEALQYLKKTEQNATEKMLELKEKQGL